jgi:hypothetical protein
MVLHVIENSYHGALTVHVTVVPPGKTDETALEPPVKVTAAPSGKTTVRRLPLGSIRGSKFMQLSHITGLLM